MANTLITPSVIARMAIARLYSTLVMAGLVHRDFDSDFNGQVGNTISVRKPASFTANVFNRATGIQLQDATETSVDVTLDTLLDVSFAVTSEDWALNVKDFAQQFLDPAMEAIAQKIDQLLVGLKVDVAQTVGVDATPPTDPKILIDAGKKLNDAKVPMTQRYAVLDTATTANFLKDPLFHQADQRGDTEGLREASIGRKFGFDNFMSQNMTGGDSLAFHRDAFALVTRTLPVPRGVAAEQASVQSYKGLGLRVIYDYDSSKKQDVVSVDLLCGVKTLDANKAVVILG